MRKIYIAIILLLIINKVNFADGCQIFKDVPFGEVEEAEYLHYSSTVTDDTIEYLYSGKAICKFNNDNYLETKTLFYEDGELDSQYNMEHNESGRITGITYTDSDKRLIFKLINEYDEASFHVQAEEYFVKSHYQDYNKVFLTCEKKFDNNNLLVEETHYDESYNKIFKMNFYYNSKNFLITTIYDDFSCDDIQRTRYINDDNGNVINKIELVGDGIILSETEYFYDNNSNVIKQVEISGGKKETITLDCVYDDLGNCTEQITKTTIDGVLSDCRKVICKIKYRELTNN